MTRPAQRTESPATEFAVALLGEFVRQGVRDVVVCPGSRSQALALSAAEFARRDLLRLHVRIDERAAGFLALGLAVESDRPVLVITTSGSAVANLHPAALEAHHSGVPLILLTADRPEELRGIASNQTANQCGIFEPAFGTTDVPAPVGDETEREQAKRLAAAATGAAPAHLNLQFTEPLSGTVDLPDEAGSWSAPPTARPVPETLALAAEPGTVVIAGQDAGEAAERAARELGAPLIAEVGSGARFGPNLVVAYRRLLRDADFGGRVRRAIVFGHPTLSREVPALLTRPGMRTIVVRHRGPEAYNPGHAAEAIVDALRVDGDPDPDRSWAGSWVSASRAVLQKPSAAPDLEASRSATPAAQAAYMRQVLAGAKAAIDRRMLVESVWAATWPHDRLVFAASRLIREADRFVPGKRIRVHSNRGLSGIDGTIGTALGIALAAEAQDARGGTTRVVLGDLALLHDAGSLALDPAHPRPRVQLIVGNDGGGTIFDSLEAAATSEPDGFDRVMLAAQQVDFAALARAYGWEHVRAETRSDLERALTSPGDCVLIEVPLPRA